MKNILVPTDFSENAWNAIIYGMALYEKTECNFYLTHIHPIMPYSGGEAVKYAPQEILEHSILKDSNKKLQKLLKKIEQLKISKKHKFHTSVHYGFFTDYINYEVNNKKIDLIIMGTKGASGIRAVSMGTNTGNVITKVQCPVLAVPENAKYRKPKEIGFPTNFKLTYSIRVLDTIKELTLLNGSAIRFLYVKIKEKELNELQQANRQYLQDYFKNRNHSFHTIEGKKLDVAVECFVESLNLDMLVMVTKNLNFLERILFKPNVEKISYHISIPFLVLHQ